MKSEVLIVASIKDGAGLSLSANSLALSKIKELQASSLPNKDALINSITSAVNVIVQKDQIIRIRMRRRLQISTKL